MSTDHRLGFSSLIQPVGPVTLEAFDVHQMDYDFLVNNGESLEDALTGFIGWLEWVSGEKRILLLAHNAAFDLMFLYYTLRRGQGDHSRAFGGAGWSKFVGIVDTLQLFHQKPVWGPRAGGEPGLDKPKSCALEALYQHVVGQPPAKAHDAIEDVKSLAAVLSHQAFKGRLLDQMARSKVMLAIEGLEALGK